MTSVVCCNTGTPIIQGAPVFTSSTCLTFKLFFVFLSVVVVMGKPDFMVVDVVDVSLVADAVVDAVVDAVSFVGDNFRGDFVFNPRRDGCDGCDCFLESVNRERVCFCAFKSRRLCFDWRI